MLRTLVLSTAAVMLSTLAVAAPAAAADPAPAEGPTITVVGDSITSWFRDEPGSVSQGWWSMMARDLGASIRTYAEAGSGMNIRGNNCHGTTFGQRLRSLETVDYLIIQGGRNDMSTCDPNGLKKPLSPAKQKAGIKRYLARLGDRVDALGIPRSHVLVVSPWGKSDRKRGYKIQAYMRKFSNRNHEGFTFVETKTLPNRLTFDHKHPNRDGNLYLARVMRRAIQTTP
ncbi:MAG: SGNH/GDSL hydrolase family protein [Aeromicrobium sp.]|jgi:lysophospholipase L1-like esterase